MIFGKTLALSTLLCSTLFAAQTAWAESADRTKPIEINAQNFAGDEVAQTAVYSGAVEVHQGTLEILGDKLTLKVSPEGYRTITVTGAPVKMREKRDNKKGIDEWVHASALTAVYDERHDLIIFTDNAKLARSENGLVKDSTAGNKITYDLLTARSRVEGEVVSGKKSRVTTVLAPRNQKDAAKTTQRRSSEAPRMQGSSRLAE